MGFERFTKPRSRVGTPKASIWSRGQIGFNQGAVHKFNLNDYKYAVLFYDRDTNRIGVRFTNNEEEGIIKLVKRQQAGLSFSAQSFLNYYGIDYSKTRRFDLGYDDKSELHVINLQ